MLNCSSFFIYSLSLNFIVFLLLRMVFKALKGYSISKVLRNFSLWGFLIIGIFDGNTQQFAFYTVA